MALKVGRGASAPPFIVMDVITAANARAGGAAAGRAARHPHGGRPARHRRSAPARSPPPRRRCGPATRWATPRRSAARRCASGSRAHYRDWYGAGRAAGARRGDGGRVGRVPAGVPGRVRPRRPGGAGGAVLPALRQHPDRAGHAAGGAASRAGDAVPADASRCWSGWTRRPTG